MQLYIKRFRKIFPFFSSRDVRNIQSAISLRLTDFDLEEDWFENPDKYFKKGLRNQSSICYKN